MAVRVQGPNATDSAPTQVEIAGYRGGDNLAIKGMRPVHPGEVLREEFLEPLDMTPAELARFFMCRHRR